MQKEFHISGKKKNTYPSKKVINLYYKEDKTTRPSTIALYVLFILVVALAVVKVGVFDLLEKLDEAESEYLASQQHLEEQMAYIKDYEEISSQYSRYSYSYLNDSEKVISRLEILEMLEETVYREADVKSTAISANIVSLQYTGLTLEETSWLVQRLNNYNIVEKVEVNTASLSGSGNDSGLSTSMVITLADEAEIGGDK